MRACISKYFRQKNTSAFVVGCWVFLLIFSVVFSVEVQAQVQQKDDLPSPKGAFFRSLVVPGWGHYYAENDNWNRGKYHLAGEVVLVLSYFGLDARANYLEQDYFTFAEARANTDLSGKSRDFIIAVGNYDNLAAYNDAQLRTRNWDQVFPESSEYQWNWESTQHRFQYQDARERVERNRSQLPTLVALMVANRLVSGISAFIHARDLVDNTPEASFSYVNTFGEPGITANLRFNF
ncbi:hypothetical protein [Gracilimonas sediminicola]|uniref:DUF5683 domain-containing protein n=1 Tax=Gracilimonas sediminicola TaxID=2952158 RepID=A0A9X2RF72_9BACT|nr:hypothetical protein [Gracilimonas sediminicola]MCP9290204.1 hypothetical protein [Gracilimonas sediminicola]